jgi:anti-sigma-K factor RskA
MWTVTFPGSTPLAALIYISMETKSTNEELIARYLLGDLPEEEQARLEDRAFSDRDYMRNIVAVESDLIDEYVRGGLSDSERRRFERRFLASAERQRKVEFARALANVIPRATAEDAARPAAVLTPASWWNSFIASLRGLNPAYKFSTAAAALTLVIGVSWLIAEAVRLRAEVAQLQAERQTRLGQEEILRRQADGERARNEDLAAQLQRERGRRERSEELARQLERDQSRERPAGSSFIASVFLPPGVPRGAGNRQKLIVPQAARLARLQIGLEREDDYRSFRVELRTAQGKEVWTQDDLRPRSSRTGRILNLLIPGSVFNAGAYELTLKGVNDNRNAEDVRYYYFDALMK